MVYRQYLLIVIIAILIYPFTPTVTYAQSDICNGKTIDECNNLSNDCRWVNYYGCLPKVFPTNIPTPTSSPDPCNNLDVDACRQLTQQCYWHTSYGCRPNSDNTSYPSVVGDCEHQTFLHNSDKSKFPIECYLNTARYYCTTQKACSDAQGLSQQIAGAPKYFYNLCTNAPDTASQKKCIDCYANGKGGLYTALGCISFSATGMVSSLLKIAIGVGGGIALLLMVMGAFKVAVSGGDPKAMEEGKGSFTSALVGLLVIIFSVVILRIIGVDILKIPGF